jgi:hypothetical protein
MTGVIAAIWRHPVKGHGRESLADAVLALGQGLPWDRHWAVAHEAAKLVPGWNARRNFAQGARAPALMALESSLDTATRTGVRSSSGLTIRRICRAFSIGCAR